VFRVYFVSELAQAWAEKWTSVSPCPWRFMMSGRSTDTSCSAACGTSSMVSVMQLGISFISRGPSSADGSKLSESDTITNVRVLIFFNIPSALITALPSVRVLCRVCKLSKMSKLSKLSK